MTTISDIYRQEFSLILTEELHPELNEVLDSKIPKHYKFNSFTKKIRSLIASGKETGLTDDKPMKGSSRAVMFHATPEKVKIDGVETELPTVLKVAFSGSLDKHLPFDHPLLGEMQNIHEHDVAHHHGVLEKIGDNEYRTREGHPFMAPVIDGHEDGAWMHVAKLSPINAASFREATKTESHPKGISDTEFREALEHHVAMCSGERPPNYTRTKQEKIEELVDHPLVESALNMCLDTGTHPGDFSRRNLGMWEHPVTKRKYVVASDAGFSHEVAKAYQKARLKSREAYRGW